MQSDFANWFRWEQKSTSEEVVEKALGSLFQRASEMTRMQQEQSWQSQHPDIDIESVKAFAQSRGVTQLDDAYTLMTLQNRELGIAQNVMNRTVNQIRQPNTASPLRGQPAPVAGKQSYEALAKAYADNPEIEKNWPEQLKVAFWQETNARDAKYRKDRL